MAVADEVGMARRKKAESDMAASPQTAGQMTVANLDRERVAMRAYELYLARGGGDGQAEQDWFTAEREVSDRSRPTRES
jgi:hypothetical protein